MVKKNIKICDVCQKAIAEGQCFSCNKDLCSKCRNTLNIELLIEEFETNKKLTPSLTACGNCSRTLEQAKFEDKEFGKELTKMIKPYLTKKMILEKLEDKKEPSVKINKLYGTPIVVSGTTTASVSGLGSGAVFVGVAQNNAKAGDMVSVAMKGTI